MEESIYFYCRCISCFKNWKQEVRECGGIILESDIDNMVTCDFCSDPKRTSIEVLYRMADVLPCANVNDFPKFITLLMKHVVLKEGPEEWNQ